MLTRICAVLFQIKIPDRIPSRLMIYGQIIVLGLFSLWFCHGQYVESSNVRSPDECPRGVYALLLTVTNPNHHDVGVAISLQFPKLNQLTVRIDAHNWDHTLATDLSPALSDLRFLSMTNSLLDSISPNILRFAFSMETFELSRNNIRDISAELFKDINKMRHIKIDRNKLKILPQMLLRGLEKFTLFWAQGNEIVEIPKNFFVGCPMLTQVDFSNNKLFTISLEIFNRPMRFINQFQREVQ